ncbi:MAG: hypothetical protein AAFQ57_16410 [Cyanobacteria bacterium J06626_14]
MPDDQHHTFEIFPIAKLEQLFANLFEQWAAKGLNENARLRLDEVAGTHAAGQVPKSSRIRDFADPEGRPQYFVRVHGAGLHYAVDAAQKCVLITRIDMPRWEE